MSAGAKSAWIRWSAWFDDVDLRLDFPSGWSVRSCPPALAPDIGDHGVAAAFAAPIGTARLRERARGRTTAVVVIDDLSRPTRGERLIPPVLAELAAAGIPREQVTVLVGAANHRVLMRADLVKKLGEEVLRSCRVRNHFSWTGNRRIGVTARGTPVELNEEFLAAEVKVLVGSIVPHPVTGFSGGAKLVLPAVASIDSAKAFHDGVPLPGERIGMAETAARHDADEAGRMAGVDFIVNSVPTPERGIAALVTGDLVQAHRAGTEHARRVYATADPGVVDVCVFSSYPKDNEFLQFSTALSPWLSSEHPLVRDGGTVVIATASTEGAGFHSLYGPGMPFGDLVARPVPGFDLVVFSPGVATGDLTAAQRETIVLCGSWEATRAWLSAKHGAHASVAVFPCGTTQLLAGAELSNPVAGEAGV